MYIGVKICFLKELKRVVVMIVFFVEEWCLLNVSELKRRGLMMSTALVLPCFKLASGPVVAGDHCGLGLCLSSSERAQHFT